MGRLSKREMKGKEEVGEGDEEEGVDEMGEEEEEEGRGIAREEVGKGDR